MNDLATVTTGEVRLSYVHLTQPYAAVAGQEEKYSVTVLVPKSDAATMQRIQMAIEDAKKRGSAEKWNGVIPPVLSVPVYDGDGVRPSDGMPFGDECKGHFVFTASCKADRKPEVVDANCNPIINQSEIYSGMYGRVNCTFFPYMFGGKKGVGCALGPVQKLRDGESLGGGSVSAAQAFGAPQAPAQTAIQQPTFAQPTVPSQYGYAPAAQPAQYQAPYPQYDPITGMPL